MMTTNRPLSPLWVLIFVATSGIRITRSTPDRNTPTSDASDKSSANTTSPPLQSSEASHTLSTDTDISQPPPPQVLDVPGPSSAGTAFSPSSKSFEDFRPLSLETRNLSPQFSDVPGTSTAGVPRTEHILSMDDISEYSSSLLSGLTTFPSVKFGDGTVYRLELEEPSHDDPIMNAVREKIGETPENMSWAMKELVDRLKSDEELHVPWENDAWLVRFLRARKYNVEKTLELIKKYYTFKEKNKSIYDDLAPSKEKDTFEQEVIIALPKRDQSGSRIIIARANKWDRKKYPVDKMCRMVVLLLEVGIYEPVTQLAGIQIILDLMEVTWAQVFSIIEYLVLLTKMLDWIQHCVPLKVAGIHVVNEPKWFWSAYNLVQHVLPTELKEMLQVHGKNWTALQKQLGKSNLPAAYGGELSTTYTISSDQWKLILEHQDPEYDRIKYYGVVKKEKLPSTSGKMLLWRLWSTGS